MKTSKQRRLALSALGLALCAPLARADWQKIAQSGHLKVAVYDEFLPFSDKGAGVDVDLAGALANRLGLKLSLLPFPAGEAVDDDLRNMVWKGHYLGYGPADLMLHVPVDKRLMAHNDKVEIFAPYHVETVRLVRSVKTLPRFDGVESLAGKRIGVEKVSIAAMVMLGEANGALRDNVRIYDSATAAVEALTRGELDAVLATRSEIESVIKGDTAFPLEEMHFQRLPRSGWAIGMAVRKEDTELAKKLQAAVNDMAASGELPAIFARYGVQVVEP